MENQNNTTGNSAHPVTTSSCGTEDRPCSPQTPRKGKRIGPKRPFMSGHVWETRQYLKLKERIRDLALFNLGIDSKLRACDLLDIQVSDVSSGSTVFQQATIVQKKTEVPVTFEITDATRASVQAWIEEAKLSPDDFLWRSRNGKSRHLSMSQYSRIIKHFVKVVGADPAAFATHSIRRTKVTLIYRKTQNLRACQLLLGHKKIENTVRYLGLELDDALKISRDIDI
jgi:integrase